MIKRKSIMCKGCGTEMKYQEHDDAYVCPDCGANLWMIEDKRQLWIKPDDG